MKNELQLHRGPSVKSDLTDERKDMSLSSSFLPFKSNPESESTSRRREYRMRHLNRLEKHKEVTKDQIDRLDKIINHAIDLSSILDAHISQSSSISTPVGHPPRLASLSSNMSPEFPHSKSTIYHIEGEMSP